MRIEALRVAEALSTSPGLFVFTSYFLFNIYHISHIYIYVCAIYIYDNYYIYKQTEMKIDTCMYTCCNFKYICFKVCFQVCFQVCLLVIEGLYSYDTNNIII